MTDVDPQIPQGIEQPFSECTDEWVGGIVAKEHDIDVAVEAERGSAVPADRNEGHAPARTLPEGLGGSVRGAVKSAQEAVERARVGASRENPRVATAHRVLEGSSVSTEIAAAGLTELWGEAT
jgi:hypothetical protein